MTTLEVTGLSGGARSLDADALERFAADLDGIVARPGDDAFVEATSSGTR